MDPSGDDYLAFNPISNYGGDTFEQEWSNLLAQDISQDNDNDLDFLNPENVPSMAPMSQEDWDQLNAEADAL